jgi:hypothetical protein
MTWALIYLIAITIAEALTASIIEARQGIILHSLILVVLILQGAATRQVHLRRLLLVLALAPLIRIVSISLPLKEVTNFVYWYLIIGTLLFMGALFAAKITGLSFKRMGFSLTGWPKQLVFSLTGFLLGFMEYFILRPPPLIPEWDWGAFLFAALVLMIFTGLLEEFIFRGLVQEAAIASMGAWGILYGAVLFAILHLGYRSWQDVLFVFIVGLTFGFIVQRTRSLLGVTLTHGFTNISMYLIFPFLITSVSQQNLIMTLPQQPTQEFISAPGLIGGDVHFPGRYSTATQALPAPSPLSTQTPFATPTFALVPSITPYASPTLICTGAPSDWIIYIVQRGDTLSNIAARYGTTVAQLQSANCLQSTLIVAGQKLYVPNVIINTPEPTLVPSETPTPLEPSPTLELPSPTLELPSPTGPPPTETPPPVEPSPTP